MTTDPEALRAKFEKLLSDSARACLYEGDGQYAYPHDFAWICFQAGHAVAVAERDYWRKELHALLDAADAVATNNAHAVSTGSARYAKHSQTWETYALLDKARQRAADATLEARERRLS